MNDVLIVIRNKMFSDKKIVYVYIVAIAVVVV